MTLVAMPCISSFAWKKVVICLSDYAMIILKMRHQNRKYFDFRKKTEKRKTAEKEKDMVPNKQKEDIDNDEMEILSQYMLQPDQGNLFLSPKNLQPFEVKVLPL